MDRGRTVTRRALAGAVLAVALLTPRQVPAESSSPAPTPAPGEIRGDVAECYDAHEAGQLERKRGQVKQARQHFAACGRGSCPPAVQRDCVAWASELAALQPSVVVSVVHEDGSDVLGASTFVDGTPVSVDGRPLELDPGPHRIRVEVTGLPARDLPFTVQAGDRARRLPVVVAGKPDPAPAPEPRRAHHSSPPPITYVLGGVAALGAASFVTFAVLGKTRENELERTCVDRCSDEDVAHLRTRFLVADISLGVAVLAAGAAIVTWILGEKNVSASTLGPTSVQTAIQFR